MVKYVQINSVPNGSTGSVMRQIQVERTAAGDECWMMWGRGRAAENDHEYNFGTKVGLYLDVLQTRVDGRAGFHSKAATRRLLAKLDEIKPDVVHLHNVHGYYVNIEMLFEWLAKSTCHVNWTLHDCWAFTGHCAYFTYVKCAQWQSHCAYKEPCCQINTYPKTISKASVPWNFEQKKRLFTMLPAERMTLVTPSQWLANLVKESFLKDYPVEVRHNTVDKSVFNPTPSDFRERYGLESKFVVLGVASPWTERKGLSDFVRLATELNDSYAIVLVGLSKKQIKQLPKNIIAIERTESNQQLTKIYTAADVHIQPSCEETFGMTVAEACACGTSVIVRSGSACEEAATSIGSEPLLFDDFDSLKTTVLRAGGGCLMICLERTDSRCQLAALYSTADIFFNPTKEDNYPTVNLESEVCGTPVLTYDTGGCRETIANPRSKIAKNFESGIESITMTMREKGRFLG